MIGAPARGGSANGTRLQAMREQLRVPLVRNAYSLVGSTIATSVLGVAFWIIAARTYKTADVGVGATLISTMVLLSNLAQLNLTTAFNRFVPTAGNTTRRLVLVGYGLTVALSAAAAVVFLMGINFHAWAPQLRSSLLDQHAGAAWFVVATMMWTVFALEDAVLTGLGEAPWVLLENSSYGVLKIVALVAVAGVLPHLGVFVAWTVPLIVCIIGVNRLLLGRLIPARTAPPSEAIEARAISRFVSADYVNSLMWTAANALIPLITLGVVGKTSTAYVFTAYTFAYPLHLITLNVGMSMITEAAHAPDRLGEYARKTVKHCLALVVPLAAGLCVAAPLVLRVYGKGYADHATHLTQLFALSAVPGVFVSTYLSMMRARRAMAKVLLVTFIESAATLVLMSVLLRSMGISGVGLAWLIVQTTMGFFLLFGELRSLWLPSLGRDSSRAVTDRARSGSAARTHRADLAIGTDTLESSGLASRSWELEDLVVDTESVCVLAVRSATSGERGILKVATAERGSELLRQGRVALQAVRGAADRALAEALPRVLESGITGGAAWTLETRCPGLDARTALDHPEMIDALLVDVIGRMSILYGRARPITIDDGLFARLVDKPLAATASLWDADRRRGRYDAGLARVRAELRAELLGRELAMSLTHGDLWLGNMLWDPLTGAVTGLVDWHRAAVEQPVVDVTHLLMTTRALVEHRELGVVVREGLHSGSLRPHEEEVIRTLPGAGEVSTRAALLLAWLGHISDNAVRTPRAPRRRGSLDQNARQVLESL